MLFLQYWNFIILLYFYLYPITKITRSIMGLKSGIFLPGKLLTFPPTEGEKSTFFKIIFLFSVSSNSAQITQVLGPLISLAELCLKSAEIRFLEVGAL